MVTIEINSTDRSSLIDWKTFRWNSKLTSEVDTLDFVIRKHTGQTYKPALLDDIVLKRDSTKLFAGKIVEVEEVIDGLLEKVKVRCKDHRHEFDQLLVINTYEDTTINAIIEDIKDNFMVAGATFTTTNVDANVPVDYVAFNYEQPSKCLQQLAELVGYDWYIDPDKDIHFFSKSANSAPFNLTDTNGKFFWNSFRFKQDVKNLRNTIFVRGGEFLGDTATETVISDGEALIYKQGSRYSGTGVTVGGTPQTVGVDNIDDAADFDVLYNFQEKFIRFKTATKPADGLVIAVDGSPHIPVLIKKKDNTSIATFGEYQHKIIDKSINSKEGARDRADGETIAWGDEVEEGSFLTIQDELCVGQQINFNSTIRGINQDFIIKSIDAKLHTPTQLIYDVRLITTQTMNAIEFLQKLLINKDKEIEINPDEILDKIEAFVETLTLSETVVASTSHNPQSETITFVETPFAQPLDYATEWVLGDYKPTISQNGADKKRTFLIGGSYLN